ncbi:hypothetical protein BCG9842_B0906 [Bacillus cereus G9842]|uniref:DUF3975 domain-containing protein n=4 Tax=Bacillus cereus group TaxID=86661 RepID=B7IXK8_BACC2|nr:hypothetical protein BCG9842_B0906 [Bacillus cereus G9842]
MWKEKGNQLLAWITLGIVILLQISFHIIESLFHKVLSILTFFPNMTLEIISIVWSIIASIAIVIIWVSPNRGIHYLKRTVLLKKSNCPFLYSFRLSVEV